MLITQQGEACLTHPEQAADARYAAQPRYSESNCNLDAPAHVRRVSSAQPAAEPEATLEAPRGGRQAQARPAEVCPER